MTGRGSIRHNNRSFSAANVDRSRSGQNVTFCNEDLKKVYHELFDEALAAYNAKKKKTRDKIPDYYEHIRQSKQEKLFHEAIFQIGNLTDCGCGSPGGERAAAALKEFAESFQERNPHLRVFNMVLHMDEATPHLHVDFVPVATEQSRGLSTRVSMKQALKQQGFEGMGRKQTEWKAWMEREKEALTEIAQAHEFEIISLGGGRERMELPEYRAAAVSYTHLDVYKRQVFDLDGVGMPQLRDTLHQMNKDILPQATFVVNSGTGLHLYYVLKEPVPMYPYNQKCLKELKYSLTRQIWNKFTSTIKEPQMQGILQGFRVVGSGSKLGREYPVRAFRLGGPVELARLLDYIPDSNGEQQRLEGLMRKSRLSLAEAKEKYPDWYERRIIKKERRGRWTVKRDLYDWWLHRIADEIRVGHRFYGIMTLAIYAKKCGIDEDELRRDAFALLRPYDDMSVEDINRFTKDDVVCALEMFNEDYVTFPRDDIAKLSGLTMPVNKRNWRKQPVHLQGARAIQEINDKANGTNWREGNGRPKGSGTAQARVYEWRQQHPEGRKADCHRETGLDPKTVRKWWDCPPPAVRFENGHITVRVSPSQELSDWLLDALHDGGQE